MKARDKRRRDDRKARLAAAGVRPRCPIQCLCICHDTGGGVHDHDGSPCPGKLPVQPDADLV